MPELFFIWIVLLFKVMQQFNGRMVQTKLLITFNII